jgi:2-aminoadipate transaminase
MQNSIKENFPAYVQFTEPEGGMFLWVELPKNMAAIDLFDIASKDKVVFVPGDPFYINKHRTNTLRLNFSCVDKNTIQKGIQRLGRAIRKLEDVNGKIQ